MTRKVPFENNEYYHVFNRGVEKRKIFLDEEDYLYFTHILKIFNDSARAENVRYFYRSRTSIGLKSRNPLVEIISYSLLPNHYHFLIKQVSDGGISKFLQKIGTGYAHYFNKKYKRSGVLFQGKTKSKHVDTDKYLNYLKQYIELNPLDLFQSKWKEGVKNKKEAVKFLNQYKWKSPTRKDLGSSELFVLDEEFADFVKSIEVGLR